MKEGQTMDHNDYYTKKLLSATRLCAFCTVLALILLLAAGAMLLPRAVTAVNDLSQAAANINAVDWKGLSANVGNAADNLAQVDFDKLCQTIDELQKAIAPVAELFGE